MRMTKRGTKEDRDLLLKSVAQLREDNETFNQNFLLLDENMTHFCKAINHILDRIRALESETDEDNDFCMIKAEKTTASH